MDMPQRTPLLDLLRTTAPAVDVLDLDTVKLHLKVDDGDDDALIKLHLATATGALDGYSGTMGRCLIEQTWTLYLDAFPDAAFECARPAMYSHRLRELKLPLTPLIAVDSITYEDQAGVQQTLDPATYVVRTGPRGSIVLRRGVNWPLTSRDPRCVIIQFRSGWAAKGGNAEPDPTDVPAPIRQAMLLMIGDLYENREAIVVAESRVTQILNPTADNLLTPLRADFV